MVEKYFPKLCQSVLRKHIPKTTNPAELAIGGFEKRYHLIKGFTSFYYAQFLLKAFQVYYHLCNTRFGPLREKIRIESKPHREIKLYLLPHPDPWPRISSLNALNFCKSKAKISQEYEIRSLRAGHSISGHY